MSFKSFRIHVILRVILITLSIFLFYYSFSTHYIFTPVIVGAIIVFLIVSLIRYIDKTNRELSGFLESIRFSEFTRNFNMKGMGKSFEELDSAFNEVINDFQRVRAEKEEHFYYLQTILQNIDVCVIAYRSDGTIELINKAAKKLFQVTGLRNIQGLETLSKGLVKILFNIQPGQNELIKVQDDDDFLQLAIYATNFKIKDKVITLVTIKDIQSVLEEQETEAWQKLIRVLTHEIMNSIAPISSISTTLSESTKTLPRDNSGNIILDSDTAMEFNHALRTIHKRSEGLHHFVNTYRNLTKIPQPNFTICKVSDIIANVSNLMVEEIKSKEIRFVTKTEPENITLTADGHLIEQVLINLLKNAVQALSNRKNGQIKLISFFNKRGRVTIQLIDNGPGILPEVLEKVFIPFFTTKTSGSGIGLSLSRQILKLHNGSITAQSIPDKETIFTLTF
jgi:two-component system, NtrC family, nitrogen regulation sensor histidine kinase NtrY